jgi:hypothetical protein
MTAISDRQKLAYANAQAADGRVNVEIETDEGMTLNMGPQHPATHGTLRIVAKLDGEQVIAAENPTVGTITDVFAGADWHERETWEMYGFNFDGHPGLRHLYLPGAFEGFPLRKDFPLLAREIKPWPGLVDKEPMPGEAAEPEEEAASE